MAGRGLVRVTGSAQHGRVTRPGGRSILPTGVGRLSCTRTTTRGLLGRANEEFLVLIMAHETLMSPARRGAGGGWGWWRSGGAEQAGRSVFWRTGIRACGGRAPEAPSSSTAVSAHSLLAEGQAGLGQAAGKGTAGALEAEPGGPPTQASRCNSTGQLSPTPSAGRQLSIICPPAARQLPASSPSAFRQLSGYPPARHCPAAIHGYPSAMQ